MGGASEVKGVREKCFALLTTGDVDPDCLISPSDLSDVYEPNADDSVFKPPVGKQNDIPVLTFFSDALPKRLFKRNRAEGMEEKITPTIMERKIVHREMTQALFGKPGPNCLSTSFKIVNSQKNDDNLKKRFSFFSLGENRRGGPYADPNFNASIKNRKISGHQVLGSELSARRGLSYTLCMLNAGKLVPLGVSYWNGDTAQNGVDHWIVAYGYKFELTDKGWKLTILAHDVGINNNNAGKNKPNEQHVEFLVNAQGNMYKSGKHNVTPPVRGGQTVVAIGLPYEIEHLIPST